MGLLILAMKVEQLSVFSNIWVPWLRNTIGVSPQEEDRRAMADPLTFYGETGGAVFLASLEGEIVGAVAVKGLKTAGFEFCKLIVTEAARGQGAGRALVEACIDYADKPGGPFIYLQSFRKLDVAIRLYGLMGFVDAEAPPAMVVLGRTEVIMRKAAGHSA